MDDEHLRFTEESLRSQDGKKVPLTLVPGGPVVGEATMKYNEETGSLEAHLHSDDPDVKRLLGGDDASSILFKKEEE